MNGPTCSSCPLPEGIRYYILRDAIMVPLIPADQLPFLLREIPCQLNHRQMSDQNWKFLVESTTSPCTFSIQTSTAIQASPLPPAVPHFLAPDSQVRLSPHPSKLEPSEPLGKSQVSMLEDKTRNALPSLPLPGPSPTLTTPFTSLYQKDVRHLGLSVSNPSGIIADHRKKEYCTHWIKTGECAFISVGCKFKHEIPSVEKLRQLGFTQGTPKWWKEKTAVVTKDERLMQHPLAQREENVKTRHVPAPRTSSSGPNSRKARPEHQVLVENMLQNDAMSKKNGRAYKTIWPMASSSKLNQAAIGRAHQTSSLLIDIHETHTSPSSLRLSDSPSTGTSSFTTASSSSRPSSPMCFFPAVESLSAPRSISVAAEV